MRPVERLAAAAAWIWVVAVMAAYLYQFRHLAGPIAAALGIT